MASLISLRPRCQTWIGSLVRCTRRRTEIRIQRAGEVALAAGADDDAPAGKAILRKKRRIAEPLVYRYPQVLH